MADKNRSDISKDIGKMEAEGTDASEQRQKIEKQSLKGPQLFASLNQSATAEADQAMISAALASQRSIDVRYQVETRRRDKVGAELLEYRGDLQEAAESDRTDVDILDTLASKSKLHGVDTSSIEAAKASKQAEVEFLVSQFNRIDDAQRKLGFSPLNNATRERERTQTLSRSIETTKPFETFNQNSATDVQKDNQQSSDLVTQNVPIVTSPQKLWAHVEEPYQIALNCCEFITTTLTIITSPVMLGLIVGPSAAKLIPSTESIYKFSKTVGDLGSLLDQDMFPDAKAVDEVSDGFCEQPENRSQESLEDLLGDLDESYASNYEDKDKEKYKRNRKRDGKKKQKDID